MKKHLLLLSLVWLASLGAVEAGEPPLAAMPAALGVQIEKPAGDNLHFAQGSGVFLGGGLVLTAAHVVTINAKDPAVSVILDGWKVPATVVATAPSGLDLALVRIDPTALSRQRLALTPLAVCTADTAPNQAVVVTAEGAVTLSQTVGAAIHSATLNGDWTDILATGYHHGSSGGGVINAQQGCLAGIIVIEASRPAGPDGPAIDLTQFVPASKIAPFLANFRGKM